MRAEDIEPVWLPYPDGPGRMLRAGERVTLNHVVHREWIMEARVVVVTTRTRSVEVRPDEPITSPANWMIMGIHDE